MKYLNQKDKQHILVFGAFMVWVEELLTEDYFRPYAWDEIKPLAEQILGNLKRIFQILLRGCDMKQRKQLENANRSSRVTVLSECDPRANQKIAVVDWDDFINVVGYAVDGHCRFCDKDKNKMKKCSLRYSLLRAGASDPNQGIGYGDCEFSKG